eukprot:12503141-Alexandrium_andersonii.AAC.1
MSASLVGSEMCIRDSDLNPDNDNDNNNTTNKQGNNMSATANATTVCNNTCLLYTSDAADDM